MRLVLLLLAVCLPVAAAEPKPEVSRDATIAPQAVGTAHTVRTIPEACARLEGMFTGDAAQPYDFVAVRTSPNCQPRTRFVDAAEAKPSIQSGWILNDVLRIPNAACPTQLAVVRVWRKPAETRAPQLDAQGRSRIYLDEQRKAAAAKQLADIGLFAAQIELQGMPCAR